MKQFMIVCPVGYIIDILVSFSPKDAAALIMKKAMRSGRAREL